MALRTPARIAGKLLVLSLGAAALAWSVPLTQVQTTLNDFKMPGTQENVMNVSLASGDTCATCHGHYDDAIEPYSVWASSMMAQASRDPMWYAAMAIANQDAAWVGDLCIRCHAPQGWLQGKSVPVDGSALDVFNGDMDGVGCHFCHRMVDPIYEAENPIDDQQILANLTTQIPTDPHSGQYVVDPDDNRRGPYDLGAGFGYHLWRESPFHRESMMCGTCHDVTNPAFSRQLDGTYALNTLDAEHPTHDKRDGFPSERTFSEWQFSQFAKEEIEMGGLFGGNKTAVSTCQDCHMPDGTGRATPPQWGGTWRTDLPLHEFNGGNTWVLRAIRALYPDYETGLTAPTVDASINRAHLMLQNASELEAFVRAGALVVRVQNNTGHKLPTGYPEGRRMWLNVKYRGAGGTLLLERGAYDPVSASLYTANTTVFEAELGVDAAVSAATGVPVGPGFHFALNNVVYKDNRVPPRGFTNAGFDEAQSPPVAATYLDEQFWSDSTFYIPIGTEQIEVALYYQTTSKEYIEFLRNENTSDNAGNVAYRAWETYGKSAPALMASLQIQVAAPPCPPPIDYGYVIPNSSTNEMVLAYVGTPSSSINDFELRISGGVPNAMMAVFVGTEPGHIELAAGDYLVAGAVTRLPVVQLDGTGSAAIPVPVTPALVDQERYYQAVVRDPGTPGNLALSNGLHVDYCN
jgi:cytochrome c553